MADGGGSRRESSLGENIFSLSDFAGSVSISAFGRSGEMADALDSKSSGGNTMRVQLPPPAFLEFLIKIAF